MSIRTALVIGGGISGLTAATALAQRGVEVELVELKEALGDENGVGLSIMGNASKALATIGVAQSCVAIGMPADHFTVRAPDGQVVATPQWPALGKPDWPAQIGISRPGFHRILGDAAVAAGVRIRCGVTTRSVEQDGERAHVVFTDREAADYDLVVAADGIYSTTRSNHFPEVAGPEKTGQGVWRALLPRPVDITTTQLHFGGPLGVVGICPISAADCYLYCIHASRPGERYDPANLHVALRHKLAGYGGPVAELASQLVRSELVSYRPLEWILVEDPWHRGPVVLIGDAAHANPPNVAQGAAMGIEDAVVLAEEVTAAGPLAEALGRYMARRRERAALVVDASRRIARDQVEHTPGFDASAEIGRVSNILAESY